MTIVNPVPVEQITLDAGKHASLEEGACIMEWASYLAGEPWSDHPECVSPVIGAFCREWNDALPNADRTRILAPFAVRVIGTNTGAADDETRAWMAADWLIRVHTPAWLRRAGLDADADALSGLPEVSASSVADAMGVLQPARKRASAAWDAARATARDVAGDVAGDAAGAAARDAAGDAARDAAGAAAWDAARATARATAWDAAWDAAWAAAGDAAGGALDNTVAELQASAVDLLDRMCEVGR